jgi:hypothetical protein
VGDKYCIYAFYVCTGLHCPKNSIVISPLYLKSWSVAHQNVKNLRKRASFHFIVFLYGEHSAPRDSCNQAFDIAVERVLQESLLGSVERLVQSSSPRSNSNGSVKRAYSCMRDSCNHPILPSRLYLEGDRQESLLMAERLVQSSNLTLEVLPRRGSSREPTRDRVLDQ